MEKKIDILIPAYHAQDTINRTLSSLAIQSIIEQCNVVICNDAGGDDYKPFVEHFSKYMDIREIVLPKNGGCGVARQYGIDNTSAPFWICQDADDTFANAWSLEVLLKNIEENEKVVMVSSSFVEQVGGGLDFKQHNNDMVWMHGKIYRRAFMDKYGIRFNHTRSNEDNGLNTLIRLCANENEKIRYIPDITHYWHYKADSITRINNYEYTFNQSFEGYTDNMIDAIEKARIVNPSNAKAIDVWGIKTMAELYVYFFQGVERDPRFTQQNFQHCGRYYNRIFKPLKEKYHIDFIKKILSKTLNEQAPNMTDIVPMRTIFDFVLDLEDRCGIQKEGSAEDEQSNAAKC